MLDNPDYFYTLFDQYALPALVSLAVLIVAAILYTLIIRALGRLAEQGLIARQLQLTLNRVTRWLLLIVVLLLILGVFGVSVTSFWTALSGVLVLVALGFVAVWSVLSNVLCSVLLVIFSPFRIGDEVEIQDTGSTTTLRGKVVDINMFFTTLESGDEDEALDKAPDKAGHKPVIVRVPNNLFFQKFVRCWPGEQTHSLKRHLANEQRRSQE
jgi:small-conductance mechanosensitive channel